MGEQLQARSVGEVVAEDYTRAAVFQRYGIDFCCGGGRSVADACRKAGADLDEVLGALRESDERADPAPGHDPRDWAPSFLADYIVTVHHGYVRQALPALRQFSDKVARVHGRRHPELVEVRTLVHELAEEMEEHMAEEEQGIFARLAEGGPATPEDVGSLEDDHEEAGELMRRIRALTDGFQPPADACSTYRATFAKLEEFEGDLHRHVHLENNILFPQIAGPGADASPDDVAASPADVDASRPVARS